MLRHCLVLVVVPRKLLTLSCQSLVVLRLWSVGDSVLDELLVELPVLVPLSHPLVKTFIQSLCSPRLWISVVRVMEPTSPLIFTPSSLTVQYPCVSLLPSHTSCVVRVMLFTSLVDVIPCP